MEVIRNLSVMIVRFVQHAAAPIATGLTLYLLCRSFGITFNSYYLALMLLSMMFVTLCVRGGLPGNASIRLFSGHVGTIVTGWLIVIGLLALCGFVTKTSAVYSRLMLASWFIFNPVAILLVQWAMQALLVKLIDVNNHHRRVVIAGVNQASRQLATNISNDAQLGLKLLGFFEDRKPERIGELNEGPLLGNLQELPDFVRREHIDAIYIALPIGHLERTKILLEELQDTTVSLYFVPDIFVFDLIQARIDDINGQPVFALLETPFYGYNGTLKRLFDLVASAVIVTLISPIMLAIAVGVKLSSPGPVLFKQRRYGLAGEEIKVYKFRTMTVTEDGADIKQACKDDERFTPFGAWLRRHSLDELPQFLNVIQGRMSVVGPRPHAVAHNEQYRKLIKGYMIRHKVLPGITGWAQVNGCRGETREVEQMENRIRLDLEYLRKWSLALDLKIILRTMGIVINDKGAH